MAENGAPEGESSQDAGETDSGLEDEDRSSGTGEDEPLPPAVVDDAEALTRRARRASDPGEASAYRSDRDDRLAAFEYTARVREEDTRDVLVLHPAEWVEDGLIRPDRIDDLDRGIEIPLSGPAPDADWESVEAHNRTIAEQVAQSHGEPHGATAHALADFASNHYAKRIGELTPAELEEFREEYLPRNAWPTDAQVAAIEASIGVVGDVADADLRLPGGEQ